MLQALLADRFQVQLHRETKEFPVYALEVASGGLKMKELPADPEAENEEKGTVSVGGGGNGLGATISLGKGSFFTIGAAGFEIKKLRMDQFADSLARFMDRPVLNMTNLKGSYDFTLELSPEDRNAMLIRSAIAAGVVLPPQVLRALDFASGDSLANGLRKVGLTLESRKAPIEILVIDSAQKTPTEN